jgi:hypothetical protein
MVLVPASWKWVQWIYQIKQTEIPMSQSRKCEFVLASNKKWYVILGNFEYAYDEQDCTVYGPFATEEKADEYVSENFANPGSSSTDDSGERIITKAVSPRTDSYSMFGRRRF